MKRAVVVVLVGIVCGAGTTLLGQVESYAATGDNNCDVNEPCLYKNAGPNTPLFDVQGTLANLNNSVFPIGGGQVGDEISAIRNRTNADMRFFIGASYTGSSMCVLTGHTAASLGNVYGLNFNDNISSDSFTTDPLRCV